jgi:hypothetical protein
VEGVRRIAALRGGIGQRADGLQQLHDRARPAVGHDQRQGVVMPRLHVDEVDVDAVDLGRELRQGIELCRDAPEVVLGAPIPASACAVASCTPCELLDKLLRRPTRGGDASTQVVHLVLRDLDTERPDLDRGFDHRAMAILLATGRAGTDRRLGEDREVTVAPITPRRARSDDDSAPGAIARQWGGTRIPVRGGERAADLLTNATQSTMIGRMLTEELRQRLAAIGAFADELESPDFDQGSGTTASAGRRRMTRSGRCRGSS